MEEIKAPTLNKLKDCTQQIDKINKFLKQFISYKESLLDFKSYADLERSRVESVVIPENYFVFQFFDKSVCLINDNFFHSEGVYSRSSKSYYHIVYRGFEPFLLKDRVFSSSVTFNKYTFANVILFDDAKELFLRAALDCFCHCLDISFSGFLELENILAKNGNLF